jgi:hypothetical protein
MRRWFTIGVVLVLFALDWAALHDIIKGNEPDVVGEWAMVVFSFVVFSAMSGLELRRRARG